MAATASSSPEKSDQRLRRVWDAVRRPDVKVLSTDVFDTLLWRQVPEPVDVFPLVAARLRERGLLAPALSPEGFARLRVAAERTVRQRRMVEAHQSEVSLEEIYAALPPYLFNHADTAAAMRVEIDLERDLLVPDLDVLEVLLAAREAGKDVIAVSDIYFTGEQLRGLLAQPALDELEFTHVFTSCDHRTNKSGGLFEIALEHLGVRPEEVVHMGDNVEADVEYPGKLGIDCHAFDRHPEVLTRLLEAEARHLRAATTLDPATAAGRSAAGVAVDLTSLRGKVATREERGAMPAPLQPFWDHGALVQGPVFTGFAEWVQERAQALGAGHLHCFMREGAFLGELVDRAGDYLGTQIRSSPLWLNREVLGRAIVSNGSAGELEPLIVRRRVPTVDAFLRSIGLGTADLPRFAGQARTRLDDPTVRATLFKAIEDDDAVRAKVVEHSRQARDRVVRYVERLLGGADRLVVVDLGWAGSAQGMLRQVLQQAGMDVWIAGLYLATHEGAAQRVIEGGQVWGYVGEFGAPKEAVDLLVRSPEILEQICMPDHGSQVDLGDDLQPVLAEGGERSRLQSVESDAVRKGVRAFQREWARYRTVLPAKIGSLGEGGRDVVRPLLVRSVVSPTEEEAAIFGAWLHDENQGSRAVEAMVNPALLEQLRHLDPDGLRDLPMQDLYWPFGLASKVDRTWGDLMSAAAGGHIPWESLSGEVDTGRFEVRVEAGTDVPENARIRGVPKRNRFGLSAVHGTLRAPAIAQLAIRPSEFPAVVRIDFLDLRCHTQGDDEPVRLRLEAPDDFLALQRINCFALNPNVFVVHRGDPILTLDLAPRIPGTVFRVDVACGFATIALGELLPTPGRLRSVEEAGVVVERLESVVEGMKGSLSWKVTSPLRRAKNLGSGS